MFGNQDELIKLGPVGSRAANFLDQAKDQYEAAEREVRKYERQRQENLEMLLGNQWCVWDNLKVRHVDGKLILRGRSQQEEYLTDNVLHDLLMKRVAATTGGIPIFEAVPGSSQQADFTKAKYATKLIPALWYHRQAVAFLQTCVTGAGYYNVFFGKVAWDDTMGRVVAGSPEGEIALVGIPPTSMMIDPAATRVMPERIERTDAKWLFELGLMTLGELRAIGEKPRRGNTPTGGGYIRCPLPDEKNLRPADSQYTGPAASGVDRRNPEIAVIRDRKGDLTARSELRRAMYYEQPDPDAGFSRGRYCLMLPDNDWRIVEYRECLPDDARGNNGVMLPGLFPFFTVWDEQIQGQLAGHSRTSESIPYQRAINTTLRQITQTRRRFGPVTWYDKSMAIDMDNVRENTPIGTAIPYDSRPGGEPPKTDWPTAAERYERESTALISFYTKRMEDRMGIHTMRSTGDRTMSATEFAHNMRVEDQALSKEAVLLENTGAIPMTKLMLQQVQRHYGNERIIRTLGNRNRAEVMQVMAEDVSFADIVITAPGSSMPVNRARIKAEVMASAQLGFFTPKTGDPAEAKRKETWFADLMQLESSIEESSDELDIRNARAENMDILAGKGIPPPQVGDNDAIHLYGQLCHWDLFKTPDFRNQSPDKRASQRTVAGAHIGLHMMRLEQRLEALKDFGVTMADLLALGLSRVKPGPSMTPQQTPGPVGMPPAPGQPVDTTRQTPSGPVRVYQETPGVPKTGNLIGPQGGPVPPAVGRK